MPSVLLPVVGLGLGVWAGLPAIWAYLAAINAGTFGVYGLDKQQAKRSRRRVPEWALLTMVAAGGSPGGWLGSRAFRHKTLKASYRVAFWLIVTAQLVALVAWGALAWKR